MLTDGEMLIRLIVAVIAGLLIGISRRHMPAGIRTFALLCFGSAIFTVISISGPFAEGTYDPTRIIGQIVAGIGFLGLGVIWREGANKPGGLTTAAAIWTTASIGVLVGLGMWVPAAIAIMFVLAILYSKKPLVEAKLED